VPSGTASPVDVSAIVVSYDRDAPLRTTLECLLRQEPAPREIILVDQTARHDPVMQAFLDGLVAAGRIVRIEQAEPNAQRARNRAIEAARGEVLLFVDDDVVMETGLVQAHWTNYRDPDIAAVCGFFVDPGEADVDDLPPEYSRATTGWIYFPHCYSKRIESHLFLSGNGSVRRDIAVQLGGFDENFVYTLLDDTDFACRLKKLGVTSVHDPAARLRHLKIGHGGRRPGGVDAYVIADASRWYTWIYFFVMNFGWRSWRELAFRLRACVFRRANLTRPWRLARALGHLAAGTVRAAAAISRGRKLAEWHRPSASPPRATQPAVALGRS
jgi:GT2 family glycosyltransferase